MNTEQNGYEPERSRALVAIRDRMEKEEHSQVQIIRALVDDELCFLQRRGRPWVRAWLFAGPGQPGPAEPDRVPLYALLIDCSFRARAHQETDPDYPGGFLWQIVVDSFQSHLLNWVLDPGEYDVRVKLLCHLDRVFSALTGPPASTPAAR